MPKRGKKKKMKKAFEKFFSSKLQFHKKDLISF